MMFSNKFKPLRTFNLCAIDNLFKLKMAQPFTALGPPLIETLHSNQSCEFQNHGRIQYDIQTWHYDQNHSEFCSIL
jgi:hypothetical protein